MTKIKHKHDYELLPENILDQRLLKEPLTRDNYVDKFHTLLYYEEHEHARVLKDRYSYHTYLITKSDCIYEFVIKTELSELTYMALTAYDVFIALILAETTVPIEGTNWAT